MPNRILKESVCVSESIDALSFQEEVFFYRLLVNCDDFGRMDGRDSVLKARLFPLREFTPQAIAAALARLEELGMVRRYRAGGRPYLQVVKWEAHQTVRAKRSKYPAPDAEAGSPEEAPWEAGGQPAPEEAAPIGAQALPGGEERADASIRVHPHASASTCAQGKASADACARNPIQSESETESESEAVSQRGLLSAADAARWREETEAIEGQAARMGMAFAPSDRDRAERLMAEYSAAWLLEAMGRAAGGQASCRSWRYIEGILKAWREKGGIDLVHGGSDKGGAKQGHGTAEGPVCPPLRIRRY